MGQEEGFQREPKNDERVRQLVPTDNPDISINALSERGFRPIRN